MSQLALETSVHAGLDASPVSPPKTTSQGSVPPHQAEGVARPGPTSKHERLKAEALRVAQERRPDAERFTPQMVDKEICFHAYKDGVGLLTRTEVFV